MNDDDELFEMTTLGCLALIFGAIGFCLATWFALIYVFVTLAGAA